MSVTIMDMMQKCDKLRMELVRLSGMDDRFDALQEYRLWWYKKVVVSEAPDSWPNPCCFEYKNIHAFAKAWKGESDV